MKERWFNYRPICLVFLFLLMGSFFSFYINKNPIIVILVFIVCVAIFMVLAIARKKLKLFLIPLVAFLVGITLYNIAIIKYESNVIQETPETISARIYSVDKPTDKSLKLQADSVVINGKEIGDNIIIYITDASRLFENFEIGSKISFSPSSFYHNDLFYYETPNANLYSNDLRYTAYARAEDVTHNGVDTTFVEELKAKVKANLGEELTNENAEIAYSAIFGEKEMLSEKQYNSMRLSGVAHLMAVSGLHVGIIVAILLGILKLLRANKWWKFAIIAIFLLLYAYVCNFAVSVIRASIMALMLLLATNVGREYDSFSAISLAGIVCFLINPLCAFDVGFLLSFSCVFGIVIFNKSLNRFLQKYKMSNAITTSLAMSLSTMLALIFVMAYFFNNFNLISIIANVIIIPLFTIAFIFVFVVSAISLLIPVIAHVLAPVNYIFDLISIIAKILGNLPLANILTIDISYIAIFMYFMLLLLLGRMCTARSKNKVFVTLPIVTLLVYLLVI